MKLNPNAIAFWALFGIVGYLIDGSKGSLIGLAIGLSISLLVAAIDRK